MCVLGNIHLQEKVPRGNGTLYRRVLMKLKENAESHQCKNYYSQKMLTVCSSDVEWIEMEHVVKKEPMADIITEMDRLQICLSSVQFKDVKHGLKWEMSL